jgi:hypothetical protein
MWTILSVINKNKNESKIDRKIREVHADLGKLQNEIRSISCPEELDTLEQDIREKTNRLAALLLQKQLQANLDSEENKKKEAAIIATCPERMKNEGYEDVTIKTSSGHEILVQARYYRRNCDRKNNKRHKGVYAGLLLLGIHERTTPWLASLVSSCAALLSSFREVCQVLTEQGIRLGEKVVRKIAYRYADRVRIIQKVQPLLPGENLSGRRVVVSMDGGRVRVRENKPGCKTTKGRTRYHRDWQEPKLFIIYVVNQDGKIEKSFAPLIDGGLQGADALFEQLHGYLKSLCIQDAEQVLFVADGAHWIWNRIPELTKLLGLKAECVHELIDFYHAVEHLGDVAALQNWSAKRRKTWIHQQRKLLKQGHVEQVAAAIGQLCRGSHRKEMTTERNYFINNKERMRYPEVKSLSLPIGSGAIESAIRRIVNLRLKGPSIFWHKENAEKILVLRAFYKTGRWNQLKSMACSPLAVAYE